MIFEITDKSKRNIRLTKERWKHINADHPEVAPLLEEVKTTLQIPTKITSFEYDETIHHYYRHRKENADYLQIVVKYLNGDGFIITAYLTKKIQ